jgi:sugar phosphate isomerase/epimerase
MNIEETVVADYLQETGNLLWHAHFANSNHFAPSIGHLNFQELVAALKEMSYDGYLSAEIIPVPDSHAAAKAWIQKIRPMIASK